MNEFTKKRFVISRGMIGNNYQLHLLIRKASRIRMSTMQCMLRIKKCLRLCNVLSTTVITRIAISYQSGRSYRKTVTLAYY